jgi:carbon monoxide dehydrogenase subunit G
MTPSDPGDVPLTRTDTISERIDHPIEVVWPLLSDFGGISAYMQGVEVRAVEGSGVGAVRLIPQGDAMIRERLESFDADRRTFSYHVLDPSPLDMSHYVGEVALHSDGPGACRIEWRGSFAAGSASDPEQRKKGLEGFYRASIAGLKTLLAARAA